MSSDARSRNRVCADAHSSADEAPNGLSNRSSHYRRLAIAARMPMRGKPQEGRGTMEHASGRPRKAQIQRLMMDFLQIGAYAVFAIASLAITPSSSVGR